MDKKKNVLKVILATIIFWIFLIVGPFLIVLWNELSLIRYDQGTLGYLFFATIVQGIAAIIACYASSHVFDGGYRKTAGVNSVVAATLSAINCITSFGAWQTFISNVFTLIVLIFGAVICLSKEP